MTNPITFGPRAVKQIASTVGRVNGTLRNPAPAPRGRWQRGGSSKRAVVLDEPLPPATHSMTSPSSAIATVLEWDDDKYVETDEEVEVFNHSESTGYKKDTFGWSEVIDGHECFGGDCAEMRNRD